MRVSGSVQSYVRPCAGRYGAKWGDRKPARGLSHATRFHECLSCYAPCPIANGHVTPNFLPPSQLFIGSSRPNQGAYMPDKKTAIVTGAQKGIGAGLVDGFLKQGYNLVATSRNVSQSLTASPNLVLVDGDIGKQETAAKAVDAAIKHFASIDVLVNNAGIFRTKPFTDFTTEDFHALVSTNLLGFLYITQLAVKQMLKQASGNVVTISASLVDQPFVGEKASVSMITKGGLNAVTRSLAIEYAKEGIRFNAVAPGVVDTPLHKNDPKESLKTFQPMGKIVEVKDIVDAVLYLAQANQVTGEILHVDGGAHAGRW
jgi:NAD(P)-dependent dehydrogenase (short-subunit alcohol dehydrogenase family)